MSGPVLPGATVGVLGSGQLGRMLALAARRMGYRVHVFSPDIGSPTGQVADREWSAAYDDLDAVGKFAQSVDVVTLEFENIPAATVQAASSVVAVRPGLKALHTAQNRLREKTFLEESGFPVAPFREVAERAALDGALREVGTPAALKTAGFGYDGKGQTKLTGAEDLDAAWDFLGGEAVLEAWVSFEKEVSLVAARSTDGSFAHYGVVENTHEHHILDVTAAPADVSPEVEREAVEIARGIFEELEIVGTACVEFFLTGEEKLLVNEIAPPTPQLGALDHRGRSDFPVRAATPGRLRAASGEYGAGPAGGDGEPARRPLGRRRAGLERRLRHAGGKAAPLR